jgi:hypothetical protein
MRLTEECQDLEAQNKTTREEVTHMKSQNAIIAQQAVQLRTQIASLIDKAPIHEEAKQQPKDFLAQLLADPENQKLPFIKDVKEGIALVEQRINKKVNEHLGFVGDP